MHERLNYQSHPMTKSLIQTPSHVHTIRRDGGDWSWHCRTHPLENLFFFLWLFSLYLFNWVLHVNRKGAKTTVQSLFARIRELPFGFMVEYVEFRLFWLSLYMKLILLWSVPHLQSKLSYRYWLLLNYSYWIWTESTLI